MKDKTTVLYLTLHRKYFAQILRGEKTVEYRRNKPYWNKKLDGKHFDEVIFRNGYSIHSPYLRVELKSIEKEGDWYLIGLGNILEANTMGCD